MSEPTPPVSGGASDKGDALVAENRKKIADTEDSAASLPFLARWEQEVKSRIPRLAGEEVAAALLEQIAAKRAPIRVATVDGFKRAIDIAAERLASDRMAVMRIEDKVETASKVDLAPEQFAEIEFHARMRQEPRANRALAAGEQALEGFPESLKGLYGLQENFQEMRRVVVDRGSEVARSSYLEGARLRLTEIAREGPVGVPAVCRRPARRTLEHHDDQADCHRQGRLRRSRRERALRLRRRHHRQAPADHEGSPPLTPALRHAPFVVDRGVRRAAGTNRRWHR